MVQRLKIIWICLAMTLGSGCGEELEIRVTRQGEERGPTFTGGVPGGETGGREESVSPVETENSEAADEIADETAPSLSPYYLAVTEIFYDPVTLPDAAGEWFEISNLGKMPVPLDELEVRTPLGSAYLGLNASLAPGGVALVARFPYPSATPYGLIPDVVNGDFMLPNTQGFIEIRMNDVVLDRVEYGAAFGFPDPSGASLSLDLGAYSVEKNDLGSNWCPGANEYAPGEFGTPGVPNPSCDKSLSPPDWGGEEGSAGESMDEGPSGGGGQEEPEGGELGGEATETSSGEESSGSEGEEGEDETDWGWWDDEEWDWEEDEGGEEDEWPWDSTGGGAGAGGDSIVITEVHFDPQAAPDEDGEWFELTNLSDWSLDLRGLTILDNASFHVINSESAVWLQPFGTMVFGRNKDVDENGGLAVDYAYNGIVLNNSGDVLTIADGDVVLDKVAFGAAHGLPGVTGSTIQLSGDATSVQYNDNPENWCPSVDTYGWGDGGTPGSTNPICSYVAGDTFPSGPYSDLMISEVMYNPAKVLDSQGEWIELYNPGFASVDIRGLMLSDKKGSHVIAAAGPLLIPAGGYAVLARNGSPAQNGGLTPLHVYSKITLNNGGETLTLSVDGVLIDQVAYGEASGFPSADGASIMVMNPVSNTGNDVPFDWCISGMQYGDGDFGTPGAANGTCQ